MEAFNKRIADGIAWLELDVVGEPVNKITSAVREELRDLLEWLCTDEGVSAAVIISRKADQFIAGADVAEFARLDTRTEALKLVRDGQALVNRFETIGKPLVAAIHGACIGGGLEAALACTYRVASDHSKTILRLPEIRLGIIPAAGGCQRLPRLIGTKNALDVILTGKAVRARRAHRIGLVDELVHPAILETAALKAAEKLASGWRPKRSRRILDSVARKAILTKARKTVLAKSGQRYPALLAAIDTVDHGLRYGLDAGLEHEAAHFTELALGDVSRNLVKLFFASTALKKAYRSADTRATRPLSNVAIVGAGFMGSAIGGVAAGCTEVDVRFRDRDLAQLVQGLEKARNLVRSRHRRGLIDEYELRRSEALLSGGLDWAGFGRADLVIEAVSEDIDVKLQVIEEVEGLASAECIIASTTNTIPISLIAASVQEPSRIAGMHLFPPVDKSPLIEVIAHQQTASWVLSSLVSFGQMLGKTVIVVSDSPGYWVNRLLAAYIHEAWTMLEEGVHAERMDAIMTEFGFSVGPVTLLDEIGLDVVHQLFVALHEVFVNRFEPKVGLERVVNQGRLGQKTGRGLYRYRRGTKRRYDEKLQELICDEPAAPVAEEEISDRLVYSILNEAARALSEGVVASPRDGDLGAIYGLGFPPFMGGPFRLVDSIGPANVVSTLEKLEANHGDRFAPARTLVQMQERNTSYYERNQ